jgi:hypothetical protein
MKALSSIESSGAPTKLSDPFDDPKIPGIDDVDGDDDMQDGAFGKIAGAAVGSMAGGPVGAAVGSMAGDALTGEAGKNPAMDSSKMSDEQIAEWDNEPDEEYKDTNYMTKEISGGINRQKKMYKKAEDGDNAMAVESIKSRLLKALAEAKSKPDFLDVDKDKNTKEPFKKALNDKKKKPVGEAKSKPDFLDVDKDKDTKEPFKKALNDKAKGKVDELSPGTLKSYAKKASGSSHPNSSSNLSSRAAWDLAKSDGTNGGEKDDQKSATRSKYVGKAIDKLASPKKK